MTLWVPSESFIEVKPGRHIQFIVLHTAETPETDGAAKGVATYFFNGADGNNVSAHFTVGSRDMWQSVQTKDVAKACPDLNRNGIHIELVGRARQSLQDWNDPFSQKVLTNAAHFIGRVLVPKFKIPIEFKRFSDLRLSKEDTDIKGITTHWEGTKAFPIDPKTKKKRTHTDPGPSFPMTAFIQMIKDAQVG